MCVYVCVRVCVCVCMCVFLKKIISNLLSTTNCFVVLQELYGSYSLTRCVNGGPNFAESLNSP